MKIFAISDLHLSGSVEKPMDIFGDGWVNHWDNIVSNWNEKVSHDDLVLLPGDLSWAINMKEAQKDLNDIGKMNGKKIILRGNHDYWWNTISQVRSQLPSGMFAIQNDCMRFENVLVCGTRGWTCPDGKNLSTEDQKIYDREFLRLKLSLENMDSMRIEGDLVICMMHFPPFNVRREDSHFTKLLVQHKVDIVVYGHLHGKDCRSELAFSKFGKKFFLVSTDLVGHKLVEIL